MADVVVISGSPSNPSKTAALAENICTQLGGKAVRARHVRIRELPAEALLHGDTQDPHLMEAFDAVAGAVGIVIATPTYKAAYSGILKSFFDLMPQYGLSGKTVLPLATGGSLAHVLALDYALRPVLHSMNARHVLQSYFVLDSKMQWVGEELSLDPSATTMVSGLLEEFCACLGVRVGAAA